MSLATMLAECINEIDYHERSDGTTKYGDWFASVFDAPAYRTGDWCAMGLLWCADLSGNAAAVGGIKKEWAWVPSWRDYFRNKGKYAAGKSGAAPGRIIFFDWERNGVPNHVGIVERVSGGTVHTIEFNHNKKCQRVERTSLIMGCGIPDYLADNGALKEYDSWLVQ